MLKVSKMNSNVAHKSQNYANVKPLFLLHRNMNKALHFYVSKNLNKYRVPN